MFRHRGESAGGVNPGHGDDRQGEDHHDRLHEIGGRFRQKAPDHHVRENENSAQNHHARIGQAEDRTEEFTHGHKTARRVDRKKDQDEEGRGGHQEAALFPEAVAEKVRDSDGVAGKHGIGAEPPGDEQPVKPGADGKTDRGPEGIAQAEPVGEARQAHQQPAAHVRGLGAEGGDPGSDRPVTDEKVLAAAVGAPGIIDADEDDQGHVAAHCDERLCFLNRHGAALRKRWSRWFQYPGIKIKISRMCQKSKRQ